MNHSYTYYVGSTHAHDAHRDTVVIGAQLGHVALTGVPLPHLTYGVWDGVTECVALYTIELADDATAQRVGFMLSAITGNDAVLVTRRVARMPGIEPAPMAYRATFHADTTGNRTLTPIYSEQGEGPDYGSLGEMLVPTQWGSIVAYLVHRNATVTTIEGN